MNILVTGSAGFIGFHTAKKLLARGDNVIGVDDFNDYYDVKLKEDRNKILEENENYKVYRQDITYLHCLEKIFTENKIDKVCHLAARAGVRASIEDPHLYTKTNIVGTQNLLELAKVNKIKNFVFASSSSVYGGNKKIPYSEEDKVDNPVSPYAATKKSGELLCHAYHHLYKMPITCLRFFTVYGPWGRPDMAYFKFIKLISENKAIPVYNQGDHKRDFTYIDDIVEGVVAALDKQSEFEIINLGNNKTEELMHFIEVLEKVFGQEAKKKMLPMQAGDVHETYADITKAKKILGFKPQTTIEQGLSKFINWYKEYYATD